MASSNKPINTNVPEKDVFALHFLQALSNLTSQISLDKTNNRVKKIKMSAYVSMARAAGGTNRLWSRAILRRVAKEKNNKIVRSRKKKKKKKKKRVTWQMRRRNGRAPVEEEAEERRLRNIVPGGGGMESSKLMEETAHYIKCLSMQVNVMQCIVDVLSPK